MSPNSNDAFVQLDKTRKSKELESSTTTCKRSVQSPFKKLVNTFYIWSVNPESEAQTVFPDTRT